MEARIFLNLEDTGQFGLWNSGGLSKALEHVKADEPIEIEFLGKKPIKGAKKGEVYNDFNVYRLKAIDAETDKLLGTIPN